MTRILALAARIRNARNITGVLNVGLLALATGLTIAPWRSKKRPQAPTIDARRDFTHESTATVRHPAPTTERLDHATHALVQPAKDKPIVLSIDDFDLDAPKRPRATDKRHHHHH